MTDIKNPKLINFLNHITELSTNGIIPFSQITTETTQCDKIYFDDTNPFEYCICNNQEAEEYPIIYDWNIDKNNTTVTTYDDKILLSGIKRIAVTKWLYENNETFEDNYTISVYLNGKQPENLIIIENGHWSIPNIE